MFPPLPQPLIATETTIAFAQTIATDLDAFARHMVEHLRESGREGSEHFAPSRVFAREDVRDAALARWAKDLAEPVWGRAFLLWAGEHVVGHVELRGGRIFAEMHRAMLGMGIHRAFTGQGHGRRLALAAIAWARDEVGLSWIDLSVFASNTRARRLYASLGFVEQGVREDAFRIDAGVAVTDVQMSLDLRGVAPERAPR
jgi:RimJ/RimL family protein N-acetyltransferase